MAREAIEGVVAIKTLVKNAWIRMLVIDPETNQAWLYSRGDWVEQDLPQAAEQRSAS
jgi:uncharacterized protein YbcC (UPF0753/DUF2309 family)